MSDLSHANGTGQELQPWIVVWTSDETAGTSEGSVAVWKMQHNDQAALAFFSTEEHANRYGIQVSQDYSTARPSRTQLLQLMIDSFRSGILYAVLDPSPLGARQVFDLRQVLKAARDEGRASQT